MNSENYVTREELQTAERLIKVESAIDSHTDFVKFSLTDSDWNANVVCADFRVGGII